jgi:ankyrin repeat protein
MNKLNNDLMQSADLFLKEKNKNGSTCFHLACMNGHFNIVDYFLNELKVNKSLLLEIGDNYLNTPLLVSALNGHERIVELLLDNDANLNAKNKEKSTALEISCFKGYFEMSKLIMSRMNSTIDDNLSSQNNLIHLASDSGASEVVRLLLSKGINYKFFRYLNQLQEGSEMSYPKIRTENETNRSRIWTSVQFQISDPYTVSGIQSLNK